MSDPEKKKALRYRRLSNFKKFDKEEEMFQIYIDNEDDFDLIRDKLIQMELELQAERKVPVWNNMYQLII